MDHIKSEKCANVNPVLEDLKVENSHLEFCEKSADRTVVWKPVI